MKLCILVVILCGLLAMGRGASLREEFERFKEKAENQEREFERFKVKAENQEKEFEQFKEEVMKTMQNQEEKNQAAEKERKALKEKLDAIEARSPSAAFSVRLSENTLLTDSPLIYDIVNLNIGDGYDEFTGVFEPPIDGVYTLTMYSLSAGSDAGPMYIKRNDDILCQSFVTQGGAEDAEVCSAIAQLAVGDSVFVSGDSDNMALIRGIEAGFVGHIISDNLSMSL